MNAARASLLFFVGALSAIIAWAIYIAVMLLRYGIPLPSLSHGMWTVLIGLPALTGGISGLLVPVWQRGIKVRSGAFAAVSLSLIVAIFLALAQYPALGGRNLVVSLTHLDFLVWLFCAIAAGLVFHVFRRISGDTQQTMADTLGRLRKTLGFIPEKTEKLQGIALVFDVEGFVTFFNQPWAKSSVPQYLDLVFSAITTELFGGTRFWGDMDRVKPFIRPVHQKYLGDGMLYIWTPPSGQGGFTADFVGELVKRLKKFGDEFPVISKACKGSIPQTFDLPKRIRFGLAGSLMYELSRKDSGEKEYVGVCINLASRLQGYCQGLGLLVSGSLKIPEEVMEELDLTPVIATQIKGFADEPVVVSRCEYEELTDLRRSAHFFTR